MKFIKHILILGAFFLCSISNSFASHMMGADMTWECLGNDSFKVTVTVYRDCNGIDLSAIDLYVYCDKTDSLLFKQTQPKPKPVDFTPLCDISCTRCKNKNCNIKYGIQQFILTYIIDLGNVNCCNVRLSWSQCCRNGAITTGASGENYYYEAILNKCTKTCNNSPVPVEAPVAFLCKGEPFMGYIGVEDHDVDKNGNKLDSITYELVEPLVQRNKSVPWNGQYEYSSPFFFSGFPDDSLHLPKGFHLDPHSGILQFLPLKEEVGIFAVMVKEYRDGKLISKIRREFQYIVTLCQNNNAPQIKQLPVQVVCSGEKVDMDIYSADLDISKGDSTRLNFYNGDIPGNYKWTDDNGKTASASGHFSWTPGISDAGKTFSFFVKTYDNSCPVNRYAYRGYSIRVRPRSKPFFKYSKIQTGCNKYTFRVDYVNGDFKAWNINGKEYTEDTVEALLTDFGKLPYKLTTTIDQCDYSDSGYFYLDTFVSVDLGDDITICGNEPVKIKPIINYPRGPLSAIWQNGQTQLVYYSNHISNDSTITIRVEDSVCFNTDSMKIHVHKNPIVNLSYLDRVCFDDTLKLSLKKMDSIPSDKTFPWFYLPTNNLPFEIKWVDLNKNQILNNKSSIAVTKDLKIAALVTDSSGCEGGDTLNIISDSSLNQLPDQVNICIGDSIELKALAGLNYYWSNGDTSQTITISPKQNDTLFVRSYNDRCDFTDTVYVFSRRNPIIYLTGDSTLCEYDSFFIKPKKLEISSIDSSLSFYVNFGTDSLTTFSWTNLTLNQKISDSSGIEIKPGNYVFKITNEFNCSASDTIAIDSFLQDDLKLYFPEETTLCEFDSITFPLRKKLKYKINGNANFNDTLVTLYSDSIYFIEINYGSCRASLNFQVPSVFVPSEIFSFDTLIAVDSAVLVAPPGYSYNWSFGSHEQVVTLRESNWYWVELSLLGCTERDSIYVDIHSSIGIPEKSFPYQIKIYPNPANDQLTVEFQGENAAYHILGIDGKLFLSGKLNKQLTNIDISGLQENTYLIEVLSDDHIFHQLVLIK